MRTSRAKERGMLYAAWLCFALAFVFAALIVLSGCSLKTPQITYASVQAADLVSTSYAESRGAVEANPVMRTNVPTRIALKAAATAGLIWMTQKWDTSGHPRLARTVLWTLNAVMAGVVVNNFVVAK